jgi:hypothetical protein
MVAWQHGVLRYVTRRKVTIALSNKYDKRVYKVRKLSALFGDYPFQLDDFEKGNDICNIIKRKQMADFN